MLSIEHVYRNYCSLKHWREFSVKYFHFSVSLNFLDNLRVYLKFLFNLMSIYIFQNSLDKMSEMVVKETLQSSKYVIKVKFKENLLLLKFIMNIKYQQSTKLSSCCPSVIYWRRRSDPSWNLCFRWGSRWGRVILLVISTICRNVWPIYSLQ